MKIFRSQAAGARVNLPNSAAMTRQLERRSPARETNLAKWRTTNPIMRLHFARLVCLTPLLGNKEDAIREGERAVELTPVSKNAIEGATLVRYLAVIYAWAGDKDRAIQRLAETTYLPGSHIATAICISIHFGIHYAGIPALKLSSLHWHRNNILHLPGARIPASGSN